MSKRSHAEMLSAAAASSSAAAAPPSAPAPLPGRARVTSRAEFKLSPVPDAWRNAVRQAVLALVFAGENADTSRCACGARARVRRWCASWRPPTPREKPATASTLPPSAGCRRPPTLPSPSRPRQIWVTARSFPALSL